MRDALSYKHYYFIGIGGIGMSAIARYLKAEGKHVLGYDKTPSPLTSELFKEGIEVFFDEHIGHLEKLDHSETIVIYTPAVPKNFTELVYATTEGIQLKKRAEFLGDITKNKDCIAVAGTHGKTTTSCMIAHIMHYAGKTPGAFLGGISTNYNSNFLHGKSNTVIVEADEFDRSFLNLAPNCAVVTSVEADHLDVYKDGDALIESFKDFMDLVPVDGTLIVNEKVNVSSESLVHTYGFSATSDSYAHNLRIEDHQYCFDYKGGIDIDGIVMGMPGRHNVENALAAITATLHKKIDPEDIKSALQTFSGVKRRFEYCVNNENLVYIDDYAHHPTELESCIKSVRELYPGKKVTGIFQPHLYSRTRDFADEFARVLSLLDELIMLEIYPARELPVEGINSAWLLDKVNLKSKAVCSKEATIDMIKNLKPEVLLTLGAGDIDQLVEPLKTELS